MKYPIPIHISSPRRATDIALFVDRPDVIEVIEELQEYFAFPTNDYKTDEEWIKFGEMSEVEKDRLTEWLQSWVNEHMATGNGYQRTWDTLRIRQILHDVTADVCTCLSVSYVFQPVLKAVLVKGQVQEQDYPAVISTIHSGTQGIPHKELFNGMSFSVPSSKVEEKTPTRPMVAFYIDPWATTKEIQDAVKKEFIELAEQCKQLTERYDNWKATADTRTNIHQVREWYWLHCEGVSYEEIALLGIKEHENDESLSDYPDTTTIQKAVERYTKRLHSHSKDI